MELVNPEELPVHKLIREPYEQNTICNKMP